MIEMRSTLILVMMMLADVVAAQNSQVSTNRMHQNQTSLGNGVKIGENFYTSIPEPKEVEGDPYLYENWYKGKIYFKNSEDSVVSDRIKYNLITNYIEIFVDKKLRGVDALLISKFNLTDHLYVDHAYVVCNQIPDVKTGGFCEVIINDKISLFRRPSVSIKLADYDQALMVGSRNDKILHKEEFYLVYNNQTHQIKNRRDIREFVKEIGLSSENLKIEQPNKEGLIRMVNSMIDTLSGEENGR